jgi:hypothetical protein
MTTIVPERVKDRLVGVKGEFATRVETPTEFKGPSPISLKADTLNP